jgi:hypothetical protein
MVMWGWVARNPSTEEAAGHASSSASHYGLIRQVGLRQFIEQNCCILQVSRIEPLGEPPIHWRQ